MRRPTSLASVPLIVALSVLATGLVAHQPPAHAEPRTDLHGDALPPGALARLGTLRFRHGTFISGIALSADGKTITSVGDGGSVILHDATTGKKLHSLPGGPSAIRTALAPDGRTLATLSGEGRLLVRETATGKSVREFQLEKGMNKLAFSSDGRTLAVGGNQRVHVWDVQAGKEVSWITPPGLETLLIALSPDGKTLATAGWDRKERPILCLWETAGGRKLHEWQPVADMEETHALAFSPDGKRLASASGYGDGEKRDRFRLWAVPTAERLLDLPYQFHDIQYSPCGKVLAAAETDGISLHEPDTAKEIRRIPGRGPVSFSADSKILALADRYSTITFWDVATGRPLRPPLPGHGTCARKVQFLPGGKALASLGDDATFFWHVDTGKSLGRFEGPITQRVLSPDGKSMAALFWEQKPVSLQMIGLWDTGIGKKVHDLLPSPMNAGVMDMDYAPDGKTLAVGLGDRTIQFWSVTTGKRVHQLTLPGILPQCLVHSPDSKTLAVGDGHLSLEVQGGKVPMVQLVDAVTGRELRKPFELPETAAARGQSSRIIHMNPMIAFSADGTVLAAAATSGGNWGVEHVLQVWSVTTGQLLCRLERVSNRFALSPDGKSLVTTAADPDWGGAPRLWEVATGKVRAPIRGHLGAAPGAAFSPDGRLLATASQDTTVLVWDALNLNGDPPATGELSAKELEGLWADLDGADAVKAYLAIRMLVASPKQAVPFLHRQLPPFPAPDLKHLARLISDLDAERFAIREKAARGLEELGVLARPALEQVLAGKPTAEVRRRVEGLLERVRLPAVGPADWRTLRAVEVLERIGTSEARQALEALATGAPGACRTEDARAAVQRLAKLPVVRP